MEGSASSLARRGPAIAVLLGGRCIGDGFARSRRGHKTFRAVTTVDYYLKG